MNPNGLMELAQIAEQEHMREALRRSAARAARREAGVTWLQAVRMRFVRRRIAERAVHPPAAQPAPSQPAPRLRVIQIAKTDQIAADCC